MASVLFFLISALILRTAAAANLRTTAALLRSYPTPEPTNTNIRPTTFFEVTKPIPLPNTIPCSYLLLQHNFGYTYNEPPVLVDYNPPINCPSQNFERIVLEWRATVKGRQYDRIFGVWLSGVEILRSCTAEPRATGTIWTVKKDITKYKSLLLRNQTLAVYLGNIVDSTYTGVFHAKLYIHFYPADNQMKKIEFDASGADLILPISRNLPLNDGLWFEIVNSTDIAMKQFKIPRNTYRAVLEIYVSFHENDEFWYSNYPNEYIAANSLSDYPGNGPFREIVVQLDDLVAGSVWPFTVIYTGGINPFLWRPITGIGSFDLPTYDIEITPLLSKLLDGKIHNLQFSVTNALNVWFIDANLHLWLDQKQKKTEAKLIQHISSPLAYSLYSGFADFDGTFDTNVTRTIVSKGYVKSSQGVVTTKFIQNLKYTNRMVLGNEGNLQIVKQVTYSNSRLDTRASDSNVISSKFPREFNLYMYTNSFSQGNETVQVANVSLGFKETTKRGSDSSVSTERLRNLQEAQGSAVINGYTFVGGVGSTQEQLFYKGENSCYFRNVSSFNYTVLYDKVDNGCLHEEKLYY